MTCEHERGTLRIAPFRKVVGSIRQRNAGCNASQQFYPAIKSLAHVVARVARDRLL
jgi:hypothetical protein